MMLRRVSSLQRRRIRNRDASCFVFRTFLAVVLAWMVASGGGMGGTAYADSGSGSGGSGDIPASLKTVEVPLPGNLDEFVKDRDAAIRLGKSLFWDVQVGGDGQVACATCHFSAGVDARKNDNTVHPGANGVTNVVLPLDKTDFPFAHDDVVGSQGVRARTFNALVFNNAADNCTGPTTGNRQTTGRNTPPMINAIFNEDNFWDGRAKREFNGVDPHGQDSPDNPQIWINDPDDGLVLQDIILAPASAASQEVGPPNNSVEMSCAGRTFAELGRKMINNGLDPLEKQKVATDDSVLGGLSNFPANGLGTTYHAMIEAAFHDEFTSDDPLPDSSGFTQKEANFSLFWGLSIMLYDSILVADDARFDKFREGTVSLTSQQLLGLELFLDDARCASCHGGPEFTNASIQTGGNGDAFANTGVRPIADDGGVQPDNKGQFKTPSLRDVELSGPFFHTGGYLTLRQVVNFYNRGGDHPNEETDSDIRPLGLTADEEKAIVAFMLTLTDKRVECERAPFDHPSIVVPNGPTITQIGAPGRLAANCVKPFLWTGAADFHFKLNP